MVISIEFIAFATSDLFVGDGFIELARDAASFFAWMRSRRSTLIGATGFIGAFEVAFGVAIAAVIERREFGFATVFELLVAVAIAVVARLIYTRAVVARSELCVVFLQ